MRSFTNAACRDVDPGVFLVPDDDIAAVDQARAVCARCPVRLDCLALALATPDVPGIWGGLTRRERSGLSRPAAMRVRAAG